MKDLDIIVYGATGFTGGLCAEYLAANAGNVRWAIAGRNQDKLAEVRQDDSQSPNQLDSERFEPGNGRRMLEKPRSSN